MKFRLSLMTLLLVLMGLPAATPARSLAADERVLFVPDTARQRADGSTEARIEAWVYERESRPGASTLFAHYLGLDVDAMTAVEHERFLARTQMFRVDSESMKSLTVRLVGACTECPIISLPPTGLAGRSSAILGFDDPDPDPAQRWVRFAVVMPEGDPRRFRGRALRVPARGLSVISDIDDTIKISQVRDRQQLMLNTFVREFAAVPGAAARYRAIAAAPDAAFHYVSSSPIQLYPALAKFLRGADFPAGSVHLRESTAISNVIPGEGDSRRHKLTTIGRLLADFPQRRFLLIGDSGEADPEIYGEIARAHRAQVAGIRIRDVSGESAAAERYAVAFAELPPNLWQIWTDAAEIASAD